MLFLDREMVRALESIRPAFCQIAAPVLLTIARLPQNLVLDRSMHRDVSKSRDHRGVKGLFSLKPGRQRRIAFQARESLLERGIVPVFRAMTVGLQQPFDLALIHFARPMPRVAPGEFAPATGVAKLSPPPDVRRLSQVATPESERLRSSLVARNKTD